MNQKIIKICEEKFIYLNYSPRTRDNYLSHIRPFLESLGDKQVIHCNSQDFQLYLDSYRFTSVSQQNQVINAIRFLYKFGLNKKYDKVSFKRPKSEKKLPKVVDGEFIEFAKGNENLIFLVTEIGCGLAGLKPKGVAPLFKEAINVLNIHLPSRFWHKVSN